MMSFHRQVAKHNLLTSQRWSIPTLIRQIHTLERDAAEEELGVCGSLRIMFQAIRRWSKSGLSSPSAWLDVRTREGLEACPMTCMMPRLVRVSSHQSAGGIPWVQVSGVQQLGKGRLCLDLDALLSVVEVGVWLSQALLVPSQASDQK